MAIKPLQSITLKNDDGEDTTYVVASAPAIVETTESAGVASFSDGAEGLPVKSLIADINPVQSGSGDPSPSNVRPITGWTGMNVSVVGKNILPMPITSGSYANTVSVTVNADKSFYITKTSGSGWTDFTLASSILIIAGSYTLIESDDGNNSTAINVYLAGTSTLVGDTRWTKRKVITLTEDTLVDIKYSRAGVADNVLTKLMLFVGEPHTADEYTPYIGTTYPISWSDEAGTVYGGYLDAVSGLLTVTMANIASYNGETINEPWLSSTDPYVSGATPTTGAQVVYTLATPQTYQLTPQAVTTILGQNNIWADTGDVEATYIADTKLYIDAQIAAL